MIWRKGFSCCGVIVGGVFFREDNLVVGLVVVVEGFLLEFVVFVLLLVLFRFLLNLCVCGREFGVIVSSFVVALSGVVVNINDFKVWLFRKYGE